MANNETRRGSWGKIPPAKRQPDGYFLASGRYKSMDGSLVQRKRRGTTARKAEDALRELFEKMRDDDKGPSDVREQLVGQGSETTFAQIGEDWISYIETGGKGLRVSTAYEYARMARTDIVPALGALRLADIDIKTCADFLHGIVGEGRYYAKAEHNRAVLSNILTWCAGRGLIPGNPVKQVASLPRPRKKPVQIVEKEDMAAVLASVRKTRPAERQTAGPTTES